MSDNVGLVAQGAAMDGGQQPSIDELARDLQAEFLVLAAKLDKHVKNINISRIVGGVAGLADGVMAIVGAALIPVTLGISTILIAVGSSLGGAGGAVAGGASITQMVIEKLNLKTVQSKYDAFCERLRKNYTKTYKIIVDSALTHHPMANSTMAAMGRMGASSVCAIEAASAATAVGPKVAARLVAISARGVFILNVALVGLSFFDIIDGSIELHKKKGSKVGDYCRMLAKSLDELVQSGLTEEYAENSKEGGGEEEKKEEGMALL